MENHVNVLMLTDCYKLSHNTMIAPGCTKMYSYLCARSDKNFKSSVFFGLQPILQKILTQKVTHNDVDEFLEMYAHVLGSVPESTAPKFRALADLGYLPLEIKAVEEGSVLPVKNVLMTITNTHPDFYWVVGFVESILLKIWYPITVATQCYEYRKVVEKYFNETVTSEQDFLKDFMISDFGYRGEGSEENATISGAAHLLSFIGSDTLPAFPFVIKYYNADKTKPIMASVPASEHSVMCSYGRNNEIDAYKRIFEVYPAGIVSIVSDTYDIWNVLTNYMSELKETILTRDGKTVIRPDTGVPELIICGDPSALEGSPASLGCIRLLDEMFGHTINDKGYKVLNPKVGLIYGDGMYLERYKRTLEKLKEMGYAASNLVIGVGGILRNHTRDTLGFAIKATYVEVNGEHRDIEKDPVTDPGKKSHKGLLALMKDEHGNITTKDQCTWEEEQSGELHTVFKDGKIIKTYQFNELREKVLESFR